MTDHMQFSIPIKPDDAGFMGRECPVQECQGHFKVKLGTGLTNISTSFCPYCGYKDSNDKFFTKEQVEYAKSIVLNKITGDLLREMKKMEIRPNPQAFMSFGVKIEGQPYPIHRYKEKRLEQLVVCDKCNLAYEIYGVFGYCPDCGMHNSLQILNANLDIVQKMLAMATECEPAISKNLVENALEDTISSFDGFGREVCKVHGSKASEDVSRISFQDIEVAKEKVERAFSIDMSSLFTDTEWKAINNAFQKRHLFSHKMGVVDKKYLDKTNDNHFKVGQKIIITPEEVLGLVINIRKIGSHLSSNLSGG